MEHRKLAVCRDCFLMLRASKRPRQPRVIARTSSQGAARSFAIVLAPPVQSTRREGSLYRFRPQQSSSSLPLSTRRNKSSTDNALAKIHTRIFELINDAITPENNQLPTEQRVLYVLEQLDAITNSLIDEKAVAGAKAARDGKDGSGTATSALLGSVNARQYPAFLSKASLLNLISSKAEEIMRNPAVFITPAILKSYVHLQTQLHQPSSFPDIFHLYATKPAPTLDKDGQMSFRSTSPNKASAAVDATVANAALDSAIASHNLWLAVDVIDTTFGTAAFRRSKTLRKALVPFGGLAMAPFAAYALATAYADFQVSMDHQTAVWIGFTGIMAYLSTVTGLGYVVITTANDQMDRVVWLRGIALNERWLREEERAALDKVAGAWGFKDKRWRGMEEGEEWMDLRENIGRRGMQLDRVELMEGMQ